jgi:TetR/AcrR family transcriptional regulator
MASRRWGDDNSLYDDAEARRRLVESAGRCIVDRGNTEIRMADVADEAGVVRSTVYRYYATRDDLLLELLLTRVDDAVARWVRSLRRPHDAASSIRELVIKPVGSVEGDPLNKALFAAESSALRSVLEVGAQPMLEVMERHVVPLLKEWQADGQVYADLNCRDTLHWMHNASLFLLSPLWRDRPTAAKRRFVDRYIVRALVR